MKRLGALIVCCALMSGCSGSTDTTTTTTTTTTTLATTTTAAELPISEPCLGSATQYLHQITGPLTNADLSLTVEELEASTAGVALIEISSQFQEDKPCSDEEQAVLTIPMMLELAQGDPETQQFLRYVEDNESALRAAGWNLYPICGGLGAP